MTDVRSHDSAAAVSVRRDGAVDLLKSISILGVLTIHAAYGGYSCAIASPDWFAAVFWGCLARASVPVFLMCSGALLLDPQRTVTIPALYRKNLLRIVAAMYFWAAAYKLYGLLASGGGLTGENVIRSIKEIILFRQEYHLYYLHIMILVYAFLPVTRIVTAHATGREMRYLLAVWFALGIVYPTVKEFWPFTLLSGIPLQWLIQMPFSAIGYGVLGYVLKRSAARKPRFYLLLFLCGFACVFCGTVAGSLAKGALYESFLEGMSPGVAVMATGLFGFCTALCRDRESRPLMKKISKASFCVYLVHVLFLNLLTQNGFTVSLLPCAVSIPILVAAVFACSCAVYCALSHIPVVNRYLI